MMRATTVVVVVWEGHRESQRVDIVLVSLGCSAIEWRVLEACLVGFVLWSKWRSTFWNRSSIYRL